MIFAQAREYSRTGLHVRRDGWEDKWFILWRGVWWCMGAAYARVVRATDYEANDLLADDWTTIPRALASCPVDPDTGSTGGDPPAAPSGRTPTLEPTVTAPPFLPSGGALPPGSPSTYIPPLPRPPATCSFGTLTLTATVNCGTDTVALELSATGLSAGDYSVRFNFGTRTVSGGIINGPNDSVAISINDIAEFEGRTIKAIATVTGFGEGNPCRGRQQQATKSVLVLCADCAPPTQNLVVTFAGITKAGNDPSGYITGADPNGARTCVWDVGYGSWICSFTSGSYDDGVIGPIDVEWSASVSCFGGSYAVSLTNNLLLGGGFGGGVGGSAPLGVSQPNYSIGIFGGGSATVELP